MNNRTVLLLEEEAITALDVEHTLADAAVGEVVAFARRARALSWLSAHTPDLAIIDVSLWDGACDDVAEVLATARFLLSSTVCGTASSAPATRFSGTAFGSPSPPVLFIC